MGIVRKQSIRSSVFIYLGFAIGAFNFWLLPNILSTEQFGLVRVLISVCTLLAGICSLGTLPAITRFYPYYEAKAQRLNVRNKHKTDLLTWVLLISFLGFSVMVILTLVFKDLIVRKFEGNSSLFLDYFYLIYPFTFFLLLYNIYERIAWSRQFTVISNFLRETGVRLFTLIIVLVLALQWIGFPQFILLYSLQFALVFSIIFIFLTFRQHTGFLFTPSTTTRRLYRQMGIYAGFIFGGSLFILVEQYFNTILLGSRESLSSAGIFDIANFMATLLLVPKRSMQAATSATIARSWKDRDHGRIQRLYHKSAATLLIAGILILGLIWLNIDHLFDLYKPEYREGKYAVLVIGIAYLIDLGTGLNYDILAYSRSWRLDFYTSIPLVAFFLGITYLLVIHYGMMGSAYGILISLAVYNTVRCLLVKYKFKIQPFNHKTFLILIAGAVSYLLSALVPEFPNIFFDAALHSAIFFFVFAIAILQGKLSEDVTELFHLLLAKTGIKK